MRKVMASLVLSLSLIGSLHSVSVVNADFLKQLNPPIVTPLDADPGH